MEKATCVQGPALPKIVMHPAFDLLYLNGNDRRRSSNESDNSESFTDGNDHELFISIMLKTTVGYSSNKS